MALATSMRTISDSGVGAVPPHHIHMRVLPALLTTVRPVSRSPLLRLVHTERRLTELGIVLPPPGLPKANYTTASWESPTLVRNARSVA